MFPSEDARHYRCPDCAGELCFVPGMGGGDVAEGGLRCRSCGVSYSIIHGIPRFVAPENYAGAFGFQWNLHPKAQLDSRSGLPISRERFFEATQWPGDMKGLRILEAGCGAGRFTEIACQTGAQVFSGDYSLAVEANLGNNGHFTNLYLFQGDIYKLPFPAGFFDKIFCFGVLQHIPDPEAAFACLARL